MLFKKKELKAYVSGKGIPLSEVEDEVFSSGMMGKGMAIIPDTGLIVSPIDGIVEVANPQMPHAIGLRTKDGFELLLHIGIDTVSLANEGFKLLISENKKIKTGEPLLSFDRNIIAKAGLSDTVMLVVTDPKKYQFTFTTDREFITGDVIGSWK